MDYTTLVAQVGIGLAHQISESKISDIQSLDLPFSELKKIYQSQSFRREEFYKGLRNLMGEKATKFREMVFVLWESRSGAESEIARAKRIFTKIMEMDLTFGQLKRLSIQACYEDLQIAVTERMFEKAETIADLEEVHRRVKMRHSSSKQDSDGRPDVTEQDREEYHSFRKKIMAAIVKKMIDGIEAESLIFILSIGNRLSGDLREFEAELLPRIAERFNNFPLSFGELYKIQSTVVCWNPLKDLARERMEEAPLTSQDFSIITGTHTILSNCGGLLSKKIYEGNFTIPELRMIYESSHGWWREVDKVVIDKMKDLLGMTVTV
jgi:hypothetical protein